MDLAIDVPLDEAKALALQYEEVVLRTQDNVAVYDRDIKTPAVEGGVLTTTTHRLVWMDASRTTRRGWELKQVASAEGVAGGLFNSAKIKVTFMPAPGTPVPFLRLSFRSGGRDEMLPHIQRALTKKSWLVLPPTAAAPAPIRAAPAEFNPAAAGIAGLIRREERKQEESKRITTQAFSDLTNLVEMARQVVALAERYANESKRADEGDADHKDNNFGTLLHSVGITSAVTRAGTGNLYHTELARQLAVFLKRPVDDAAGMLPLTDVYCIYNRARGTDLVSPDDIMDACKLFVPLGLPLRLRTFPSGLIVVQATTHSDEGIVRRLRELLEHRPSVDAAELASLWHISVLVAREQLLTAEKACAVARDDSIQGVRFYPNRFFTS